MTTEPKPLTDEEIAELHRELPVVLIPTGTSFTEAVHASWLRSALATITSLQARVKELELEKLRAALTVEGTMP